MSISGQSKSTSPLLEQMKAEIRAAGFTPDDVFCWEEDRHIYACSTQKCGGHSCLGHPMAEISFHKETGHFWRSSRLRGAA